MSETKRVETDYLLIGFTDEKVIEQVMAIIRDKLGEGINSVISVRTLEEMQDEITRELKHGQS